MSLQTDKYFYKALSSSEEIIAKVGERIHSIAINTPDEDLDNEPVPYLIIMNDGTTNEKTAKDDTIEGSWDTDTISILVVADTRDDLADLATLVRNTIKHAEIDEKEMGFILDDYEFSATPVQLDTAKPCAYQTLKYVCSTYNIED